MAMAPTIEPNMRRVLTIFSLVSTIALAGCATAPVIAANPEEDKQADAFATYMSARFAANEHDLPEAARYYGRAH